MDSCAFEANYERIVVVGLVREGARLDMHFSESVTEGTLTGWRVEGIDYLLLRHDGTGVIAVREVITGPGDEAVSAVTSGYSVPPGPMPPLETPLAPDSDWPDLDFPLHGADRFTTSAPELSEVNSTMHAFTGAANVGLARVHIRARSILSVAGDLELTG